MSNSKSRPPQSAAVIPGAFGKGQRTAAAGALKTPAPPPVRPGPAPQSKPEPAKPEQEASTVAAAAPEAPPVPELKPAETRPEPAAPEAAQDTRHEPSHAHQAEGADTPVSDAQVVRLSDRDAKVPQASNVDDVRAQVDALVTAAVKSARESRDDVLDIVRRIGKLTGHSANALSLLVEEIAEIPSVGKIATPLEVAPHLHRKTKARAEANRLNGRPPTITAVVLQAIGEAYESGRLPDLVAAHKVGERYKVPLFGNLVVGTAPRGNTLRMQFQPHSTPRLVADILAAWYEVDFVVLIRLVLEDYFKSKRSKSDTGHDEMSEDDDDASEAVS